MAQRQHPQPSGNRETTAPHSHSSKPSQNLLSDHARQTRGCPGSSPRLRGAGSRATLKDGREVCLEPTAPWVQLIVKAILAKAQFNSDSPL
ncbi:PREDICTED: interleukin-8-like isoform X2 [Calidris pugnax]|uniref:interleukin-8-like isoform X2 n=1 Tax=Calidris pugnax TaxID=198806 RepID=UPI00071DF28E|nr:PREDICTED: interleukin-8-like isoform X2 [Calidris pugnax]